LSSFIIYSPVRPASTDLQNVNITLRILYRPAIEHLPWIHKVRDVLLCVKATARREMLPSRFVPHTSFFLSVPSFCV
jgi:hypothetical protein